MLGSRAGLLSLEFEIAGVTQVNKVLGILAKNVTDMRPAFEQIADDFYKGEVKVFRLEGAVGEAPSESGVGTWEVWKPLNPEYAARKRQLGFGSKILVRTGALKASLTSSSGEGAIKIINKLSMEIGTSVPYAKYHQGSKDREPKKIPKREPIRITKKQARLWVSMINAFLLAVGERERMNL